MKRGIEDGNMSAQRHMLLGKKAQQSTFEQIIGLAVSSPTIHTLARAALVILLVAGHVKRWRVHAPWILRRTSTIRHCRFCHCESGVR
jgi:hypothetical protein